MIQALGTEISFRGECLEKKHSPFLKDAIQEIERIEAEFSRFIDTNQLSKMNDCLGEWQEVSDELFSLLLFGKQLEIKSGGMFFLGVKNVLESWGYDKNYTLAHEKEIPTIGNFEIDTVYKKIRLSSPLEIGAIGKGYALDRLKNILQPVKNFFINAGGDIYAQGKNNGNPWKCFLEHPLDSSRVIGEVELNELFLASSSPAKRRWRNRHHLVNGETLQPAHNMLETYIVSDSGIQADGYSTMLFCMGFEKAKQLMQNEKIAGVIISAEQEVFISPEFTGKMYI